MLLVRPPFQFTLYFPLSVTTHYIRHQSQEDIIFKTDHLVPSQEFIKTHHAINAYHLSSQKVQTTQITHYYSHSFPCGKWIPTSSNLTQSTTPLLPSQTFLSCSMQSPQQPQLLQNCPWISCIIKNLLLCKNTAFWTALASGGYFLYLMYHWAQRWSMCPCSFLPFCFCRSSLPPTPASSTFNLFTIRPYQLLILMVVIYPPLVQTPLIIDDFSLWLILSHNWWCRLS